jgi:hypothetical protein
MQLFRRHERKSIGKLKSRLRAENLIRSRAGAVRLEFSFRQHEAQQLVVLNHKSTRVPGCAD